MDWFVEELITGRRYDFGNWSENVGSWLGPRQGTPDFAVFRYENMLSDTFGQLTRLAEILKIPADPEKIHRAMRTVRPISCVWKNLKRIATNSSATVAATCRTCDRPRRTSGRKPCRPKRSRPSRPRTEG